MQTREPESDKDPSLNNLSYANTSSPTHFVLINSLLSTNNLFRPCSSVVSSYPQLSPLPEFGEGGGRVPRHARPKNYVLLDSRTQNAGTSVRRTAAQTVCSRATRARTASRPSCQAAPRPTARMTNLPPEVPSPANWRRCNLIACGGKGPLRDNCASGKGSFILSEMSGDPQLSAR
jgi:hypothetical protein